MRIRVNFRFNSDTGEVETLLVEDIDSRAPAADHDPRHDQAAAEVGRVIEQHALVEQILGGTEPAPANTEPDPSEREPDTAAGRSEERPLRG
jgi:hypothetical protein